MPTAYSKERDRERARLVAERGCILRSLVGSAVHGLANPGTDDRDELGVCIEPREYVLGLRQFEHFVYRTRAEGEPSGPGDLDLTIYGLKKYARLALKGSPTTLLLLYAPSDALVQRTPLGEELQRLAPAFVSRRSGRSFLGYVEGQRRGFLGESKGSRARERSPNHAYDTKYAMHALRIAHQGVELMRTGRITLPIAEPVRSALREVRSGALPRRAVSVRLDEAITELAQSIEAADVPAAPDYDAVDGFLAKAYEEYWSANLRERL